MSFSSQHHSFDIHLATKYGIEEAIIIHHFQHWIRINKRLNKNFIDGKTWTFQSRKEIAAHFPYFTYDRIRYIIENLIEKGVIIQSNFHKNKWNKTLWYAFANEEEFVIDENSKNFYVRENSHIEGENSHIEGGKFPHVYKDTIKEDAKKKINNTPPTPENGESANASSVRVSSSSSQKKKNPPKEKPNLIPHGDFVKLSPEEYQSFVDLYSKSKIDGLIEEINDYCAASRPKGYNDYAAAIRQWMRRRQNTPTTTGKFDTLKASAAEQHRLLAVEIAKRFPAQVRDNKIVIGPNYLEFISGMHAHHLKFGDNGFREQVLNYLRKLNLPITGL